MMVYQARSWSTKSWQFSLACLSSGVHMMSLAIWICDNTRWMHKRSVISKPGFKCCSFSIRGGYQRVIPTFWQRLNGIGLKDIVWTFAHLPVLLCFLFLHLFDMTEWRVLLFVLLVKADLGKIMFFFFDNWSAKCCFRTLKALFEVLEFFNYSAVYLILLSTGFADVDLDLLKEGLGDLDRSFFDVVILLGCCIFLIFF